MSVFPNDPSANREGQPLLQPSKPGSHIVTKISPRNSDAATAGVEHYHVDDDDDDYDAPTEVPECSPTTTLVSERRIILYPIRTKAHIYRIKEIRIARSSPWMYLGVLLIEFSVATAGLIVFGLRSGENSGRTRSYSSIEGWNSKPLSEIYAKSPGTFLFPDPSIALPILAMVACIGRAIAGHFNYLSRRTSLVYDGLLSCLWIISTIMASRDIEGTGCIAHRGPQCQSIKSRITISLVASILYLLLMFGEIVLWDEAKSLGIEDNVKVDSPYQSIS